MSAPKTFADLVAGRAPCHRVHEDQEHLAFLHPSPIRPGHTILLTRRVADSVWDLGDDEYDALWRTARRLAARLRQRLGCARVCIGVVGWEVRHAHLHLVPTDAPGQFPPLGGAPMADAELAALARSLR